MGAASDTNQIIITLKLYFYTFLYIVYLHVHVYFHNVNCDISFTDFISGHIWLDDVACLGTELSLSECTYPPLGQHNCLHYEDAGVVCTSKYTL